MLLALAKMPIFYLDLPEDPPFDSIHISNLFKTMRSSFTMGREYPPRAFEVKSISADLNRLYRMGLLKRKMTKRIFRTKEGKVFGRGRKYIYRLKKRSTNYAIYLADKQKIPRE